MRWDSVWDVISIVGVNDDPRCFYPTQNMSTVLVSIVLAGRNSNRTVVDDGLLFVVSSMISYGVWCLLG